jgi:hypothetical protein
MPATIQKFVLLILTAFILSFVLPSPPWESKFIKANKDGSLKYIPDEKGNIILISVVWVITAGDKDIPDVSVVKTIEPAAKEPVKRSFNLH